MNLPGIELLRARANPLVQRLRRLAGDPSGYRRSGELWIEGEHLCSAFAGRGGRPLRAVASVHGWDDASVRALAARADAVTVLTDELMRHVSALESPPRIAFVVRWPGPGTLRPGVPSVVLDRVQDAGNVGSILRSAAAFGFVQVVALEGSAALWSPKVLRAAMGAHFGLALVEGANAGMLDGLALPLLGTTPHRTRSLVDAVLPWPCAWLFGHEGQGVAPALLDRCALRLAIPQPGGEESLNVAAAAAVCLYESVRSRAGA